MAHVNNGVAFDPLAFENIRIDLPALKRRAATLGTKRCVKKAYQAAWLMRCCSVIDLTTLAGDDTDANVMRLCHKAARPIRPDLVKALGMENFKVTTGAICVYPNQVAVAKKILESYQCGAHSDCKCCNWIPSWSDTAQIASRGDPDGRGRRSY